MEQVCTADGQEPGDICADDCSRKSDVASRARRRNRIGLVGLRVAFAAALGLTLLALFTHRDAAPPLEPAAWDPPYIVDLALTPLVALATPAAPRNAIRYIARSRGATEGRWDTLTLGALEEDGLFLRVTVRAEDRARSPVSLFVEIATQSAEIGAAVLRSARPEILVGARGPVEWADANLAGVNVQRSCIGFRLPATGANRVSGLACGAKDARFDQAKLECLIEALSVTPAGLEAGLGAVLPGAATHSAPCARGLV
jgi:hypothetical protein